MHSKAAGLLRGDEESGRGLWKLRKAVLLALGSG
jgi:hypothetical protein